MKKQGKFPDPDGNIKRANYWLEETVDAWMAGNDFAEGADGDDDSYLDPDY